jgi:hypothetical protein
MARLGKGKVVPLWETPNGRENGHGARPPSEPLRTTLAGGPRPFPVVTTLPRLPVMIPDEILDYYGWVFCQGGFLNLHMTFEQFLTVVAAISPSGLCPEYDGSEEPIMVGE